MCSLSVLVEIALQTHLLPTVATLALNSDLCVNFLLYDGSRSLITERGWRIADTSIRKTEGK